MVNQLECDIAYFIVQNKETILEDIKPLVKQFIARQTLFNGMFRKVFDDYLDEFIVDCIKESLRKHLTLSDFHVTITAIDLAFIMRLSSSYYFDRANYK